MVYYPQFVRRIRVPRTGQRKTVYKPVFPGYAFVPREQVESGGMPPLPAHLRHRYQFVRSRAQRYAEVFPNIIETLMRAEREWTRLGRPPKPTDEFEIGDKVELSGDIMPAMRVVWMGRKKLKVESDIGPVEVTPDMVRKVRA
jgi:transcription antitermination factor NusG